MSWQTRAAVGEAVLSLTGVPTSRASSFVVSSAVVLGSLFVQVDSATVWVWVWVWARQSMRPALVEVYVSRVYLRKRP
jgi:hypothetical protein